MQVAYDCPRAAPQLAWVTSRRPWCFAVPGKLIPFTGGEVLVCRNVVVKNCHMIWMYGIYTCVAARVAGRRAAAHCPFMSSSEVCCSVSVLTCLPDERAVWVCGCSALAAWRGSQLRELAEAGVACQCPSGGQGYSALPCWYSRLVHPPASCRSSKEHVILLH